MNEKILIIYAHPNTKGYNKEILKNVLETLKKKNKNYIFLDLYNIKYNPILNKEEMLDKNGKISSETLKIQKYISESNKLIFIYPIWWGTMPAILKGFIDRTFTTGFAYRYVNGIPKGLLKGKKALIFSSSGAPDIYNFITCNKFIKGLSKDVLKFCGIKSSSKIIGKAFNIEKDKEKVKKIVLRKLNSFL